jgi:superfamily II DNA or RNA helicase
MMAKRRPTKQRPLRIVRGYKGAGKDCIARSAMALRPIQEATVRMIANQKSALVMFETGVGKTITALVASQCFLDQHPDGQVIVLSTASLTTNFNKEMIKYKNTRHKKAYHFFTFAAFSNAYKQDLMPSCKTSDAPTMIVVDEAHNLRNLETAQAKAAYACTQHADKVMLLTATPLVNDRADLVALATFMGFENNTVVTERNVDLIYDRMWAFLKGKIAYAEKDPSLFAKRQDHYINIEMSASYYKAYIQELTKDTDVFSNFEAFFNGHRRAVNALQKRYKTSPKLYVLMGILEQEGGTPAVIFSNWRGAFGISRIEQELEKKGIPFRTITGSTTKTKRDAAVKDFNTGKARVIVISKAGSEGIDLKGTRSVFIVDPVWHPAGLEQIVGRAHRLNAHKHLPLAQQVVNVYYMVLRDPASIDEEESMSGDVLLYRIIRNKREQQEEILAKLKQLSI